ncbi:MAG: glutaredoxin 3 [Pseudomonadales bacterium]|nr:glutaredoxin 3 [Pseudomonadales bacterium]
MNNIVIYTTRFCPFCVRAKQLLDHKGLTYNEIAVDGKPQLRQQMMEKANGAHTVPQIWVNGTHVGGCTELMDLERAAQLDTLLLEDA